MVQVVGSAAVVGYLLMIPMQVAHEVLAQVQSVQVALEQVLHRP